MCRLSVRVTGPEENDSQAEGVAATWLSDSLLLAVGGLDIDPGDSRAMLVAEDDSFGIAIRCMSLGSVNGSPERKILTAVVDGRSGGARTAEKLSMRGSEVEGESPTMELTFADLGSILGNRLSGLGGSRATRVLEFISAALAAQSPRDARDLVLSNKLHILRNSLRPRLPAVVIEGDQPLSGNIDALVPIDDSTFFVKGWMRDGEAEITRLTAVTAEGERVGLLERLFRLELPEFDVFAEGPYRQPVDAARFVARFETSRPSLLRKPWVFEMQNETGRAVEMHVLPDTPAVAPARTKVLRSVAPHDLPDEELMSNHIFPAVQRLQERARESVAVASVTEHGDLPESPDVSIVVPLYQRIDLVEHQLLQFNRDPEIRAQELIYVLDSPELESPMADQARQFADLYRVPFRVATMAENAGFGAATNAGASVGRGRLLLLLNSDVLPAEPGWLGRMQAFHDATTNIGALGAKLLYEDDSLQHAGLYFEKLREGPTAGSWANMHYFKGLHKDLPAANVARPVPAVTAACLMIEKDLYERVEGLPDVYVQGDFEDSELCLKLLEAGRENWYLPSAELYHLEGSSYSAAERGITGSYNHWLQTRRWGQAIEDVMARYPRI
jgi:GT2 family glycosyltransferase